MRHHGDEHRRTDCLLAMLREADRKGYSIGEMRAALLDGTRRILREIGHHRSEVICEVLKPLADDMEAGP